MGKRSLGCVLYELAFLKSAFKNKGKEHPSGGSQLFSATIKRFIFLKHVDSICNYIIAIYIYLIKRMMVEEPDKRIKTQNLHDDLEVKIIFSI